MHFGLSFLRLLAGTAVLIGGLGVLPAGAQIGGVQVPERPGDERQRFPEIPLEPAPAPGLTLPPLPLAPSDQRLSTQLRVFVKRIKLTGNTVFSEAELAPVVIPYEGRALTSEDLQSLRQALTRHYIDHGYINSGAVIPDQEVKTGVIEVRIIEGRLTELELRGNNWVRDSYIKKRVLLGSENTLDLKVLQERLQLLQQDRLIDRINAELRPGLRPGESLLRVQVVERRPYEIGASFNNWRSPSVRGLRGEVYGALYNLTGFGDSLGARYGVTDGLDDVGAFYSFPFTARDTRFKLYFDRSDSEVIEEPFDAIDIRSETKTYGVSFSHPFYRTPQRQLLGELIFERRSSETFLLGQPFSFSPGVRNGESEVTVLRLVQEWVDRRPNQVLAARSIFSVGLDALGATTSPRDLPDGQFFAWLGQFQ
jgi:hemolysin activation/secretion protein